MWATCNSRREIAKYERGKVRSTGSAYWRPDVLVGVSVSLRGILNGPGHANHPPRFDESVE